MVGASKPSRVEVSTPQFGSPPCLPADVVAMVIDAGCQWIFGPGGPPGGPGGPDGEGGGPPPGNFGLAFHVAIMTSEQHPKPESNDTV